MALIPWLSNTDIEYIFNYDQSIAYNVGEKASISKTTDKNKLVFNGKKADGTTFTIDIKPPKKPTDMGGGGDDINLLIQRLPIETLKELLNSVSQRITSLES